MSAKVEAVAYNVPDTSAAVAGLYFIPDNAEDRVALAREIANEMLGR